MRVALIAGPRTSVGVARYCSELYRGLRRLGVNVDFWIFAYDRAEITPLYQRFGIDVQVVERRFVRFPVFEKTMNNIIALLLGIGKLGRRADFYMYVTSAMLQMLDRRGSYDIYHVIEGHGMFQLNVAYVKHPAILTCHDVIPLKVPGYNQQAFLRNTRHYGAFDAIIVPSECTKRDLEAIGIPRRKIRVIYYGGAGDAFRPLNKKIARQKLGLPIDSRIILYIGSDEPKRPIHVLLKAFEIVRRAVTDVTLVMAGASSFKSLQVDGVVTFGKISATEKLVLLYNSADVFVFPTLYEGFGLPPIEAMACGVPVVTTDVASLPEVVSDAALLVKNPLDPNQYAECILSILKDEQLASDLKRKGLRRASKFSWQHTSKHTLSVYEEVMRDFR